ncbi:MAG: 30S ribosomal protein S6 [Polyangiales bacterium]
MSTATATKIEEPRAREYETIYIMRSSVEPDEAERIGQRVREIVVARGGRLLRVDNWGRRRLAYPIRKATRGAFVYVKYVGLNDLVAEIERQLRLIDDVVRFQTVMVKERVRVEDYEVDPKDTEFQRLEQAEPEEEPELAQRLGLIERPRSERSEPFEREGDELEGEDIEEVVGGEPVVEDET